MFDPVLNTSELSTIFKSFKAIHIVEIVPKVMSFVDMLKKVKSLSLKSGLVSATNVTTIVSFVLNFLFGVSLLSELVNNDSCNDIGEKDLEKAPVNQIWHKLILVSILIHAFTDDLLSVKGLNTGRYGVAMLIDPVDIDVDLFIFVKRHDVIVDRQEPKNEWKHNCQQTNNEQLFPRQSDSFEDTFKQLNLAKYKNQRERVHTNFNEKGKQRYKQEQHNMEGSRLLDVNLFGKICILLKLQPCAVNEVFLPQMCGFYILRLLSFLLHLSVIGGLLAYCKFLSLELFLCNRRNVDPPKHSVHNCDNQLHQTYTGNDLGLNNVEDCAGFRHWVK